MHIDQFADDIKKARPQYQKIFIPKRGGGSRAIFIPEEKTLLIQKSILRDIETLADFPPCVMAFRKGTSILDNAKAHLGNPYMIRYDIMNFFDTIGKDKVKDELKRRNVDASLTKIILKWCFGGGHLPQGAPTSPFLANLVCTNLDKRFSALAQILGATYTRYADDIIISGGKKIVTYRTLFKRIIRTEKFVINYYKTRITVLDSFATRQDFSAEWFRDNHIVTRLAVDNDSVSVREVYLNELWRKIRDGEDNPSTRGKISFVNFITPNEAEKMYRHLDGTPNFRVTSDSCGTRKEKFKRNIDAIKLLKIIEREGRNATLNEQAVLAEFSGWGTVAAAFSDNSRWQKEAQLLRELLTEEEYSSARNVVKGSFFTSPDIARAVWKGIERLGFKSGNILAPSMGTGIFFGTMPQKIAKRSKLFGFELDYLTGRIAKQLYPQADIEICSFLDIDVPENVFDLAISNVPFDALSEEGAHDYFFVKAMNVLKPGGLLAFITSTFTLDNDDLKEKLDGVADLIAAFKLPNTTFANADTKITSDLLIFQRRVDPATPSEHAQSWREVGKGRDTARELGELMNSLPEKIYKKNYKSTPMYKGFDMSKDAQHSYFKL